MTGEYAESTGVSKQRLRSLKYEDIYFKDYADGREARAGIAAWIAFYNLQRPHQALENRTPMAIWREGATGEIGRAVDMALLVPRSLDNAHALPRYHSHNSGRF